MGEELTSQVQNQPWKQTGQVQQQNRQQKAWYNDWGANGWPQNKLGEHTTEPQKEKGAPQKTTSTKKQPRN